MLVLVVTFFTSFSALLIIAAPLPANDGPTAAVINSRSILYRRAPPIFNIPHRFVPPAQRKDTIDEMMNHYETKATAGQKRARYATVTTRWNKVSRSSSRECLTFNYHEGENESTPILHPEARIYRDKPMPKLIGYIKTEHRDEITKEGAKRYNDLSPADAGRVKTMKVSGDWGLNGGKLDKTTLTFHSTSKPNDQNRIGDPVTIHRPLTVKLPDVSPLDKMTIEYNVRKVHQKIAADPQHPATTANYATVHSNWQEDPPGENGGTRRKVVMKLDEMSEDEQRKRHLGHYSVQMNTLEYEQVSTPPPHTETSHAGPSNEVPHPSSSQEQQHSNVGSPSMHTLSSNSQLSHSNSQGSLLFTAGNPSTHTLPSNSKSLHLNSQGRSQSTVGKNSRSPSNSGSSHPNGQVSQRTAGNPLLYPGSSHPESLHHNEYYVSSPELWRPWNPSFPPSYETWHSGLYSDQLWNSESPRPKLPPSNSQMLHHPNNPSPRVGAGSPRTSSPHPGPLHPETLHPGASHTELLHSTSLQPVQHLIGSPLPHDEFYMPSPELWRPWNPSSPPSHETWHSGLYSDQLWNSESPRPKSPSSNSQTLAHSQFTAGNPSSHPGPSHASHPELLHPTSLQQSLQPHTITPPPNSHQNSLPPHPGPPSPGFAQCGVLPSHQLGPSSNPDGPPHPNDPGDVLSPEIWSILHSDSVYPYPWNTHHSP